MSVAPTLEKSQASERDENRHFSTDHLTEDLGGRSARGGAVTLVSQGFSTLDWTNDQHTSLYADDESWVLLGLYDDPAETGAETGAFENEVMQVAMDGSQRIRRLFHQRSKIDNQTGTTGYWAVPKPTISKDGRFIAFTSNWGNSGRYDLFIAKIDPAPRLSGLANNAPAAPAGLVRQRRVTNTRPDRTARKEN